MVCVESEIRGDVTIGERSYLTAYIKYILCWYISFIFKIHFIFIFAGARTVVHPKARIIAEAGPIIIGEGNLIEEQVLIINRYSRHSHTFKLDKSFSYFLLYIPPQLSREHQTRHGGNGAQDHEHWDQ